MEKVDGKDLLSLYVVLGEVVKITLLNSNALTAGAALLTSIRRGELGMTPANLHDHQGS